LLEISICAQDLYMYIYTVHICKGMFIYIYMYIYLYTCMCIYIYLLYIRVFAYMYVYIHVYVCICMYVCKHSHCWVECFENTHIYIYTWIIPMYNKLKYAECICEYIYAEYFANCDSLTKKGDCSVHPGSMHSNKTSFQQCY